MRSSYGICFAGYFRSVAVVYEQCPQASLCSVMSFFCIHSSCEVIQPYFLFETKERRTTDRLPSGNNNIYCYGLQTISNVSRVHQKCCQALHNAEFGYT